MAFTPLTYEGGQATGQSLNAALTSLQTQINDLSATGTGTVTSVSVTTANGVSGSVATATTTPAITLTLGAITPSSIRIGTVSTTTGTLDLANASSAFLTRIQAGNAAAARTYTWPTNFGSAGSALTDAAGNGTLSWAVPTGALVIGTTAITSGTATRLLYETAGNVVGEITGATSDGTALTLVAPVLGTPASGTLTNCTGLPAAGVVGTAAILGANTFTALQTITQASANAGILASTGYSLTGSDATPMINYAGTWNTSADVILLKYAVTITAAGANAALFQLNAGAAGTTRLFVIDKNGRTWQGGGANGGYSVVDLGSNFEGMRARAAGVVDFAIAGTNQLELTGATELRAVSTMVYGWAAGAVAGGAIDTGLARVSAGIAEVNNGTAGTWRDLKLRNLISADANGSYIQTPGMAVADLPASPVRGMRCYVTDSNAVSYTAGIGATVAAGGSTIVPVFYNGTNWLIG